MIPGGTRFGPVVHLLTGPADHGVVRFAAALARETGGHAIPLDAPGTAGPDRPGQWGRVAAAGPVVVHLQYTDALYGPDTATAADAFTRLVRTLREVTGATPAVTLHDLPDPADEPGRYGRRATSYRRVASAVDAVMVSSDHEAALLQLLSPEGRRPAVIPLPIGTPALTPVADRPAPRPEVAVFGFVYPGKGHQEVIEAMSGLPAQVGFTALGRTADGHDDLAEALRARAAGSHRAFQVTGFVPDETLTARLQEVAVPVAPARLVSASGSINTWLEAGRRPLVAAGPYSSELALRYPGALQLYRPGGLSAAIRATLADPGRSWLLAPAPEDLNATAAARAYLAAFETAAARREASVPGPPAEGPGNHDRVGR